MVLVGNFKYIMCILTFLSSSLTFVTNFFSVFLNLECQLQVRLIVASLCLSPYESFVFIILFFCFAIIIIDDKFFVF